MATFPSSHCTGLYFSVRAAASVNFVSEASSILPNLIELGQQWFKCYNFVFSLLIITLVAWKNQAKTIRWHQGVFSP